MSTNSTNDDVEIAKPVATDEVKEAAVAENNTNKLNHKNYLNVVAYIVNIVFTYGVGNASWFGGSTNGDLSRKYQTIVTPASSAFSIWGLIFVAQAVFVLVQLLPRFRATPLVQQGVSYWWALVCLFQTAWTFAFAFEQIELSLVFMLLLWLALMVLQYSQYYAAADATDNHCLGRRLMEFWLLQFPFAIHAGWITAASAVNLNVVVVNATSVTGSVDNAAAIQLAVGILSLAVLHAISVWVLFGIRRAPNYTMAGVLSWANGWIYNELQVPKESILSRFDGTTIQGVAYAALAVAIIIASQIVVRAAWNVYQVLVMARRDTSSSSSSGAANHQEEA